MVLTNVTLSGNSIGSAPSGVTGGNGGSGGNGGNYGVEGATVGAGGAGGKAGNGGGSNGSGYGGGIYLSNSIPTTINLSYDTITLNSVAASCGTGGDPGSPGSGGYGNPNGLPGGSGSTGTQSQPEQVAGWVKGQVRFRFRSTIAGNTSDFAPDCFGSGYSSGGWNVIGNTFLCTISFSSGDLNDGTASPLNLDTLALNWAGPKTHAVLPGSVALDHIPSGSADCGGAVKADARGIWRPVNGFCEVGAFERGSMGFLPLIVK